ncbi:MAG: hypothetical protein ACLRRT_12735 [Ruthenibacterium lactatiformans]
MDYGVTITRGRGPVADLSAGAGRYGVRIRLEENIIWCICLRSCRCNFRPCRMRERP